MQQARAKMSRKNQIVIPKQVRKVMGLRAGDIVYLEIDGEHVSLRSRPANLTARTRGILKHLWSNADPDLWLNQERDTWQQESQSKA